MENHVILELLLDGSQGDARLSDLLDRETIQALPLHRDPEIRSLTAEILAEEDPELDSEGILLQLARDEDALVRTNAVDSLSHYLTGESYGACIAGLSDEEPLVRAYAAFGAAVIGKALGKQGVLPILEDVKGQETEPQVLAALGEARYILGDESGLEAMLALYPSGDCPLQCAILNHLLEILNPGNCGRIRSFVAGLRGRASAEAVSTDVAALSEACRTLTKEIENPCCFDEI